MLPHLVAICGLALACGGWVWLQRWIARTAPQVKGPERGCGSCSCGDGSCRNETRPAERS